MPGHDSAAAGLALGIVAINVAPGKENQNQFDARFRHCYYGVRGIVVYKCPRRTASTPNKQASILITIFVPSPSDNLVVYSKVLPPFSKTFIV